jgi:opacity protein-like surface antigen
MMIQGRALITGTIAALVSCAAAHAADPPRSWPVYERPAPRYVEMVSGWYVRGDFGYRFNEMQSVQGGQPVTSFNYPDSLGVTFGGGYKYQWFRFDATVDYAPRVTARATSTNAAASQPQYTTKIDALSLLTNFYIDMGTWYGFTPYVGAGFGVTYLRSRDYEDTAIAPVAGTPSGGRTNFSWAAMGGVSYQIDARWLVDVGYRYLSMGDLPTSAGTSNPLDHTTWKRLSAQEIRIGLRFLLD